MEVEIVVPNELHTPDETIGLCDGCYGCYLRSCNIAAEVTGVSLANAMMYL